MNPGLATAIDQAIAAAVRAPSPFNTQPWRFIVDGAQVDVLLDRDRVLTVADPDAREARLSCGAAVFNLYLALRDNGHSARVTLLPDRARPDLLARVRVGGPREATSTERALAEAVPRRHTNRRPFLDRPVPVAARTALEAAARQSDARLELVDASGRYDAIAGLIRRAEHIQATDERFQAEAEHWTGRAAGHTDGVLASAAGPPAEPEGAVPLRYIRGSEALPPRPYEQQPLLAALLTRGRSDRYDVQAGVALQHVLLSATSRGLSASFLSQPLEVPATRAALAELFRDEGEIHTLLRIGYGHPSAGVPRRPLGEIVAVNREQHA